MIEVWAPIPGFDHWQASSLGRVRSVTRQVTVVASNYRPAYKKTIIGQVLRPWLHRGYAVVGVGRNVAVHRLVCLAFHGEAPDGLPHALHRDGVSLNNVPSNLYWGEQKQNAQDALKHGAIKVGEARHTAKLTQAKVDEIRKRRAAGESGRILAADFGVSEQAVCDIVKWRTWK